MARVSTYISMALFYLLQTGCAHGSRVLILSYEGSEEGYETAEKAAEAWEGMCSVGIIVTREPGHIPLREVASSMLAPEQAGHTEFYGEEPIELLVRAGNREMPVVYAHEIGHALSGPGHHGNGLMSPRLVEGATVTKEDCSYIDSRWL